MALLSSFLLIFSSWFLADANTLLTESYFTFAEDYNINEPPAGTAGKPIDVKLSLLVRKVSEVREEKSEVTVSVYLRQYWIEPRIKLNESLLEEAQEPLIMDTSLMARFWFPDLFLPSARTFTVQKLLGPMESLQLYRNGTLRRSSSCEITFVCPLDFRMYPLDVQECDIEFTSYSFSAAIMFFGWNDDPPITFEDNWNLLPQFEVRMTVKPETIVRTYGNANFSFAAMTINLYRKLAPHVLQTYLPSALFVAVSWISFLVPPDAIPGRMVLLVTTLLTLITMYSAIRTSAPRTTSLKCIEVWIIACILFVFFALLEYASNLFLKFRQKPASAAKPMIPSKHKHWVGNLVRLPMAFFTPKEAVVAPLPQADDAIVEEAGKRKEEEEEGTEKRGKSSGLTPRQIDQNALKVFPITFTVFIVTYWAVYSH